MIDGITNAQLIQIALTGGSGFIGVGIGIGIFRNTIAQVKEDLKAIKLRQAKLRGEDNGLTPLFVSRADCSLTRLQCASHNDTRLNCLNSELSSHSKEIKALNNFARWFMQDRGLKIEEINKILDPKY